MTEGNQGPVGAKVLPFKSGYAIFNTELRKKLEDSVAVYTEKPKEVIDSVEQAVCAHFVVLARGAAADFGWKLARKLAETLGL